ncbi:MAG TPA: S4 domain-containing protein [Candidatus Sulfotelmatobacter sp.]|nr:S4 domain-containing protein [Candidatus Sulfotelmatobacter sp.]
MRLDMFLKVSRLIKQRSAAKDAVGDGLITHNGAPGKAGREVKVGDRIGIETERRRLEVEVVEVPSGNVPKTRAGALYRVISSEPIEEADGLMS